MSLYFSAWDLIGYDGTSASVDLPGLPDRGRVRLASGRVLYDQVDYCDSTPGDRVRLGRVDVGPDGLRAVVRYVDADTSLAIVAD